VPQFKQSIERDGSFGKPFNAPYPSIEKCYGGMHVIKGVGKNMFSKKAPTDPKNELDISEMFETPCFGNVATMSDVATIAKGHLTANADFVFPFQREDTFFYSNAAPQWQRTNNGNFKAVEAYGRSYI